MSLDFAYSENIKHYIFPLCSPESYANLKVPKSCRFVLEHSLCLQFYCN